MHDPLDEIVAERLFDADYLMGLLRSWQQAGLTAEQMVLCLEAMLLPARAERELHAAGH